MKKIKVFVVVIIVTLILCIFQYGVHYYNEPRKEAVEFSKEGLLIFNSEENLIEPVSVEIQGENLKYIFHNNPEAVQGDIFVEGYSIFGHGRNYDAVDLGFYTEFHDSDFASVEIESEGVLCKEIILSKSWDSILCVVNIDSNISENVKPGEQEQGLLVIPGTDLETAQEVIKKIISDAEYIDTWLSEYEWIYDILAGKKDADPVEDIVASIEAGEEQISFCIPEGFSNPEALNIFVSGRAEYEDGFSMSLHFLEEENEAKDWKSGQTYEIPLDDSYTDLIMDISYAKKDGTIVERSIDLLSGGATSKEN